MAFAIPPLYGSKHKKCFNQLWTFPSSQIQKAEQRIRNFIYFSPCQLSAALSEVTGQQVYLKLDNLQRTGAFKERGALNRILLLSEDEKRRGVIAASAGNHAQAVAYHATQRGVLSAHRDAAHDAAGQDLGHPRLWRRSDPARRQLRRGV